MNRRMNRRGAVAALASIIAIMHDRDGNVVAAQEPTPPPANIYTSSTTLRVGDPLPPVRVQFDLASFDKYVFTLGERRVEFTPEQMMDALTVKAGA